jgi:hypothetical protein
MTILNVKGMKMADNTNQGFLLAVIMAEIPGINVSVPVDMAMQLLYCVLIACVRLDNTGL